MNSEAPRILRLVSLCQRLNADEYPEIVNLAKRIALYSKPKTKKKATMKKAIKEALTDRKYFDSLHSGEVNISPDLSPALSDSESRSMNEIMLDAKHSGVIPKALIEFLDRNAPQSEALHIPSYADLEQQLHDLREAVSPGRTAPPSYYIEVATRMRKRETKIKLVNEGKKQQ